MVDETVTVVILTRFDMLPEIAAGVSKARVLKFGPSYARTLARCVRGFQREPATTSPRLTTVRAWLMPKK
jgi:hypothetical protein